MTDKPFSFAVYNKNWLLKKDPSKRALTESPAFKAFWAELEEGYRKWLTTRFIKASKDIDVTTEEGKTFCREINKVIDFIRREVKPIPVDPLDPASDRFRKVRIVGVHDTIEITITSKRRFRNDF
jgi:hypothetical protein